jgi:hypothetical protein
MCAGKVGDTVFGAEFVPAGIDGVVQLLGSPTFGFEDRTASSICALKADGTAWCLGTGGDWGQFRTADGEEPGGEWTQWGERSDIVELAGWNMQAVCARYADGEADCAGLVCGYPDALDPCETHMTPLELGTGVHNLWLDGNGRPHVNDTTVFRVGNSVASCVVAAEGLSCDGLPEIGMIAEQHGAVTTPHGIVVSKGAHAGKVVDGNSASMNSVCWLTASGKTWCLEAEEPFDPLPEPAPGEELPARQYFEDVKALALAVNGYSGQLDRCVAANDGSLWCIGGNDAGKLGAGTIAPLLVETQVRPPGSVRVNCGKDD